MTDEQLQERSDDPNGLQMIQNERRRQVMEEGYTRAHDIRHEPGELLAAAECYIAFALMYVNPDDPRAAPPVKEPPNAPYWPWDESDWKTVWGDPVRNLVKAGALIAAEIDRIRGSDA